jgi:hypothetical protein
MTANQTCIFTCCSTTYCSAGSTFLYNELTSCLCTASLCASACGDSGDYCNAPPNITTQACDTCFTKYTAKGAACDTTSANSTLNAACAANSDCAAYTACADGCP